MFKTRLLSGIVLVIAALVLIITGGDVLLISTLIISYIGMFELYRIFHIEKEAVGIIGYLAATVYYCNLKFAFLPDTMVFVLGVLILMMFAYVFTYPKYKTEQVLAAFFGVFYVAVMLSYVYQTRMIEAGAYIVSSSGSPSSARWAESSASMSFCPPSSSRWPSAWWSAS